MRSFKELLVWQKAHRFALDVYGATRDFPSEERFGLTSQLRRSAVSIASNIAEGCGRNGPAEMSRFLQISIASACELISQLDVAAQLELMSPIEGQDLTDIADHVRRMLINLQANVERRRSGS